MDKRYIFKVKYRNKIIDKIDIEVNEEDCLEDLQEGLALSEANGRALDKLCVELEEIIEEE